jgi:hypothetical protein
VRDIQQVFFAFEVTGKGVLVAPDPGKQPPVPEPLLEPPGYDAQELVADGVAQGVIYLLEAIEVHQQHPGAHVCALIREEG